jgi:hypothetical protein
MILWSALAVLAVGQGPALAQDALERIDAIHGDVDGFEDLLWTLQDSLSTGDVDTTASLFEYPLVVEANGEVYDIFSYEDMVENFDVLMMEWTIEALLDLSEDDLIVTSEGVGMVDGAVWATNICADDSCEDTYWALIALNN